ncbi:hypothetical protein AQ490_25095 [Wenjunlia vitaminophila]|uniref:Lantibiotic biosynthesis protein dehydration domain-containing protein n=2 Tax=Wenjunlia vitaminophila TaxID=76728 RepID=A0A0T6LQU3_WENVI|nr:hypothetical protein AQ490_25095 [Wenjunlia vitaminophila]
MSPAGAAREESPTDSTGGFDSVHSALTRPALRDLDERLAGLLKPAERAVVLAGARSSLLTAVRLRLNRVLLLELHAARIAGRLDAPTPEARWEQFLELARRPSFHRALDTDYPALRPRLERVVHHRVTAMEVLARRLVADRHLLPALLGRDPGPLVGVTSDAGDAHRGGQSVVLLDFAHGRAVYKPRPMGVDTALAGLLATLQADRPDVERLRVPAALPRDGYGWAAFVAHRWCADPGQVEEFYRNLGRWLAVVHLLGGTDMHAENVVADGPVPVVVDCETLFSPESDPLRSGLGDAFDRSTVLLRRTVVRTGLLPMRMAELALRGVDLSAAGCLPGQQPEVFSPVIVDAGTDRARLGMRAAPRHRTAHLPVPSPDPLAHREEVVDGFGEMRARIDALDRAGALRPAVVAGFTGCELRVVLRPTQVYVELGRMLWHPSSLHDQDAAVERARDVLARQASVITGAPREPEVIAAEVDDMLVGDVPFFSFLPEQGRVLGPGGTVTGGAGNLIDAALDRWRGSDPAEEEAVIRASLLGAYRDPASVAPLRRRTTAPREDDLLGRRRTLVARLAGELCRQAVTGEDATATWIGPVYSEHGYCLRSLSTDLYSGIGGVAVALSDYRHLCERGDVPAVAGLDAVVDGAVRTLVLMEDAAAPTRLGAYEGVGGGILTWLALHRVNGGDLPLRRAAALAAHAPELIAQDTHIDVLSGVAGLLVPLVGLAERTGDRGWLDLAGAAARRLAALAVTDGTTARWGTELYPGGTGGFAHGVAGVGWALARLGLAAGDQRWLDLADAAFAFQEALYRPRAGNWRDMRESDPDRYVTSWCHGSTGTGLAAWDLYRVTGRDTWLDVAVRAAEATRRDGLGWNSTLCHGDLGAWELLEQVPADALRTPVDRGVLDATVLTALEDTGPLSPGERRPASPGLLIGTAGAIHHLLRTGRHRDAPPTVLLPEGR